MPDTSKMRLKPLLPSAWDEEILDALSAIPNGLKFVLSRWEEGGVDARGMHTLGCFAHYPELAKAFLTFNNQVVTHSTLTARQRELLILRISWLRKSEYEFVQHLILGRRAGLTEQELERIQAGPNAPGWEAEDGDLVQAADDLHSDGKIGDATWAHLASRFDTRQLMDIVFLVGCYDVLAMVMKSYNIALEPGVEPLDPEVRIRMAGKPGAD